MEEEVEFIAGAPPKELPAAIAFEFALAGAAAGLPEAGETEV